MFKMIYTQGYAIGYINKKMVFNINNEQESFDALNWHCYEYGYDYIIKYIRKTRIGY